jgi:hypothetical protein
MPVLLLHAAVACIRLLFRPDLWLYRVQRGLIQAAQARVRAREFALSAYMVETFEE